MATYAIGDVHGCLDALEALLERIQFDPRQDYLWFVGDLVNRGPQSLQVLRRVKALGGRVRLVLGNHEIYLLALSVGVGERYRGKDAGLEEVLTAPDCQALCDWLRQQPFLYDDERLGYVMVHAGLPPQWNLTQARAYANELTACMSSERYAEFLRYFEHDLSTSRHQLNLWSEQLQGLERLSFICSALTRTRFCDAAGRLDFEHSGVLGSQPDDLMPWFDHPQRRSRDLRIIHGHWAALRGENNCGRPNIYSLDGGYVWGGKLIALCLETQQQFDVKAHTIET